MGKRGPKPRTDATGFLEAAERIFDEQGYGETSLRQIIAAAGGSSTAFYSFYPSKEAVLAALVSRLVSELFTLGARIFTGARTLEEVLENMPRGIVETLRPHRQVARLALTEALAPPSVRAVMENALTGLAGLISRNLRAEVRRGELHSRNTDHMAWAMIGGIQVQITRWAVFGQLTDAELTRALTEAVRLPWAARPASPPRARPPTSTKRPRAARAGDRKGR
jgi:AcrR family transcriptional regulator